MARILAALVLIVGALALPAGATAAAPDRAALIMAVAPNFAWDGQQAQAAAPQHSAQGFDPTLCSKEPDYYCATATAVLSAPPPRHACPPAAGHCG